MKTKNTQSIKPKPKTKRGGAILGKGTYGCVFSPNIKCNKTNASSPNHVSKVFKNKESMEEEYNEMKEIQGIEDLQPYINPVKNFCTVSLDINNLDDWEKCSFLNKSGNSNITQIHQLIYEHKGTSLDTYLKTAQIDANFFKGYLHLLEGAKVLKEKKIMHRDVKLPNLLKIKDDKFIFIDFGISCNYEDAFDLKKSGWLLKHPYFIYPPEFKLVDLVYKNIKVFHNKDNRPLDNFLSSIEWKKGYNCILAELEKVFGDTFMQEKEKEFQTYCKELYTEISDNFIQFLQKAQEPYVVCTKMFPTKRDNSTTATRTAGQPPATSNKDLTESLTESLTKRWTKDEIHDIVKKYFENTCAEKADVFSLGISLLEAVNSSFNTLKNEVQEKLKSLIKKAIHFDPTKRIRIEDMIKEMQNIYAPTNTSTNPRTPQRHPTRNVSSHLTEEQKLKNCMDKYTCAQLKKIASQHYVKTRINGKHLKKIELCKELKDKLDLRPNANMKKCVGNNCENNVCM